MKRAQAVIFAAGLITLGVLLWKMDAAAVWSLVTMVGWGFILIMAQEIVAHLCNACGWRMALRREDAGSFRFRDLIKYRIIGDGVNYLTPSAQLAGEFARASLLDSAQPLELRLSGVVVAKFAQGLAQFLFALFGIALFLRGKIPALAPYEGLIQISAAALAALLGGFIAVEMVRGRRGAEEPGPAAALAAESPSKGGMRTSLGALPGRVRRYLIDHPGRFSLSIIFFLLGYAWGAFEVYWICRFLGVLVSIKTALAIEALSCVIDGILFMVPAKVGTQEGGKTAIFALLGMAARTGLAFGIVRHIRELAWSSLGLALYSTHLKKHPQQTKQADEPEPAPVTA